MSDTRWPCVLSEASAKRRQRYTGMDSRRVILPETLRVNAKVVPDRFVPTIFRQYGGELGVFHKSAEVYGSSGKFLAVFVAAKV